MKQPGVMDSTDPVQTVSELTLSIQEALRSGFGAVRVRGEISNFRRQSSGHCYFSLKDAGSQIPAVLFKGNAIRLEMDPADGIEVIAEGDLDVYLPRGSYQLIVRNLIESGEGRLQREFLRLKAGLGREGLFDPGRKRRIPDLPRSVALITSPTGAAIQDMLSVFRRRGWRGRLLILPAAVQGDAAGPSLVRQLKRVASMGASVEAVIIGRGGGSLEDLWAFNTEAVVRAVADCPVPVISAVGHETDVVLTDFAADRRAETPTAAAELITSAFVERAEALARERVRLRQVAGDRLMGWRGGLDLFQERLRGLVPSRQVEAFAQRLDEFERILNERIGEAIRRKRDHLDFLGNYLGRLDPGGRIADEREGLKEMWRRIERGLASELMASREQVESWGQRLEATSLRRVLRRGFAVVRVEGGGGVVTSAEGVGPGMRVRIDLAKGAIRARVEGVGSELRGGLEPVPAEGESTRQRIYHHPKCGTCKKAAEWLASRGIAAEWVDIRERPPSVEELGAMLKLLGSRSRILNTSGMDYRRLGLKECLPNLADGELLAMLAENGMLVKRPFVLGEGKGLTGFREAEWDAFFGDVN